jgi:diguanylate cyclase (GGDEF)-like protein
MVKKHILIVDDDPDILDVVRLTLESEELKITSASNGQEALEKIYESPPDLVILDYVMPKMDGRSVCEILKKDILLRHLPVILLTGKGEIKDKVEGIAAGADDYIVKPFVPEELLARVKMILRRSEIDLDAAPLTRLPGNVSIYRELEKRIATKELFAVCYADLDKFKVYNDKYGFAKGDMVIQETARILIKAVHDVGEKDDFIGHIGGDDFVIITKTESADQICQKIIDEFEKKAPDFYNERDRSLGYLTGTDRQGKETKTPLLSISIGVVTNENRQLTHVAQIAEIGAELKSHAKGMPRSNYVRDKRK